MTILFPSRVPLPEDAVVEVVADAVAVHRPEDLPRVVLLPLRRERLQGTG